MMKDKKKPRSPHHSSSRVIGIIGGCLFLATSLFLLIGSLTTPSSSEDDVSYASYLPAKWFEVNSLGFLDGTKKENNVIGYNRSFPSGGHISSDTSSQDLLPLGYYEDSIATGSFIVDKGKIDEVSPYGYGGILTIKNNLLNKDSLFSSPSFNLDLTETNSISYLVESAGSPYAIMAYVQYAPLEEAVEIALSLSSTKTGSFSINNVSETIATNDPNLSPLETYPVSFGLKVKGNNDKLDDVVLSLSSFSISNSSVGFSDVNELMLRKESLDTSTSKKQWNLSEGTILGVKDINVYLCSFRYDYYKATYGERDVSLSLEEVKSYVSKGWINYDTSIGASSFSLTSAGETNSPIREVISQDNDEKGNIKITCLVSLFRYHNYSSSPRFLLGTNKEGNDFLTILSKGIGLSTLVSLISSLVLTMISLSFLSLLSKNKVAHYLLSHYSLTLSSFLLIVGLLISFIISPQSLVSELLIFIVFFYLIHFVNSSPRSIFVTRKENTLSRSPSSNVPLLIAHKGVKLLLNSSLLALPFLMILEVASYSSSLTFIHFLGLGNLLLLSLSSLSKASNLLISLLVIFFLYLLSLFLLSYSSWDYHYPINKNEERKG